MNESLKEHQAQIRMTNEQYDYLQEQRRARNCTTSAYFRSLLTKDMNQNQNSPKGGAK